LRERVFKLGMEDVCRAISAANYNVDGAAISSYDETNAKIIRDINTQNPENSTLDTVVNSPVSADSIMFPQLGLNRTRLVDVAAEIYSKLVTGMYIQ